MKFIVNIFRNIIIAILALLLIFNICNIVTRMFSDDPFPTTFGFSSAVVLSGSMEPEISVGDMLIYQRAASYEVGDVVIFSEGDYFVTHRIISETEDGFVTKGDANNAQDATAVQVENIYGKVIANLKGAGDILSFMQSTQGILVLLFVVIALCELPKIFSPEREEE